MPTRALSTDLQPPRCCGHRPAQGILRDWPTAGDLATAERVQSLLAPPDAGAAGNYAATALTTAVFGTIAFRRPRAAAFFAGAVALMTAPYLGFMFVTVNRFSKFAGKLVSTVETMDAGGSGSGFEAGWAGEGGGGGGGDDWQ